MISYQTFIFYHRGMCETQNHIQLRVKEPTANLTSDKISHFHHTFTLLTRASQLPLNITGHSVFQIFHKNQKP